MAQFFADDEVYRYVGPSDVIVLYRPEQVSYQPLGNLDDGDAGKSVVVVCTIASNGHLGNCYAEANSLNDQNFVRIAMTNARKWVVGPTLRDGTPSAGKLFRLECRIDRVDGEPERLAVASEDR